MARVELFGSRRGRERGVGAFGGRCRHEGGGADTIGGAFARVVDLPAYPTDAEWAAATADVDETIVYVSSGVGSFCTFADATDAAAFDRKMAVALQAESHFCESVVDVGGEGKPRRACHVGFDVPRGVATDRDCEAMRAKNATQTLLRLGSIGARRLAARSARPRSLLGKLSNVIRLNKCS